MPVRNMEQLYVSVGMYDLRNIEDVKYGKDNDKNSITEGIRGEIAIVRRSDKVGFIEIDVLASSPENLKLSTVFASETPVPISIKDGSGLDVLFMSKAVPAKDPDGSNNADSGLINTWKFIGKFDIYLLAGN